MAETEAVNGGSLTTMSVEEVKALYDENRIVLIDVRTPAEYAFEHIGGALLAPMSGFDPARLPTQSDDRPIVLYCGSGMRSRKMSEKYLAAGFGKIAHMAGGFGAWKQSGNGFLGTDPATGAHVPRP
ncbi:rhodanese-like domain-containing protein [Roseibium sp.]|uniref:rhodanese-like domain-containing protein n=1 Tax=Roseibium sp. TaxID=1936156 RepID=UPI003A96FF54